MDERHLYKSMQQGDKEAFTRLFRTYYAPLCRFAASFIDDPDQCEEVVQDTFFRFWTERNNVEIHSSVKSFLYAAVRNACLNYLKHQKVKQRHSDEVKSLHQAEKMDVSEADHREEIHQQVHAAVESLPEKRKAVFRMVKFEEKSYKETASILGISVKTVENQMGKALEYLRHTLRDKLHWITLILTFFGDGIGVLLILIVYMVK